MINERKSINEESTISMEKFTVQVTNPMLYDRLHTLSIEYSVSMEQLINVAVNRLISDIDFVRGLRIGRIELE